MSDPTKSLFSDSFRQELKELLREVLREELAANTIGNASEKDVLLTAEEAAKLIGVNRKWLYRHANKLPFTRRISRKNLCVSEAGLRRWLAWRKPESRR